MDRTNTISHQDQKQLYASEPERRRFISRLLSSFRRAGRVLVKPAKYYLNKTKNLWAINQQLRRSHTHQTPQPQLPPFFARELPYFCVERTRAEMAVGVTILYNPRNSCKRNCTYIVTRTISVSKYQPLKLTARHSHTWREYDIHSCVFFPHISADGNFSTFPSKHQTDLKFINCYHYET